MPYSFMLEVLSINSKDKFKTKLVRFTILCIPIPLVLVIVFAFIKSFKIYNMHLYFNLPSSLRDLQDNVVIYGCLISSAIFITWSLYYYYTEFTNLKILKEAAAAVSNQ